MKVGATIFSLMGMLREDYFGTLEKLAATGCKYIEYVTTPTDENGVAVATPAEVGRRVKEMGHQQTLQTRASSPLLLHSKSWLLNIHQHPLAGTNTWYLSYDAAGASEKSSVIDYSGRL